MGSKAYTLKGTIRKLEKAGFTVSAQSFNAQFEKIIASKEKHVSIEILSFLGAPLTRCTLQSMACHYYPLTSIEHAIEFSRNQYNTHND